MPLMVLLCVAGSPPMLLQLPFWNFLSWGQSRLARQGSPCPELGAGGPPPPADAVRGKFPQERCVRAQGAHGDPLLGSGAVGPDCIDSEHRQRTSQEQSELRPCLPSLSPLPMSGAPTPRPQNQYFTGASIWARQPGRTESFQMKQCLFLIIELTTGIFAPLPRALGGISARANCQHSRVLRVSG